MLIFVLGPAVGTFGGELIGNAVRCGLAVISLDHFIDNHSLRCDAILRKLSEISQLQEAPDDEKCSHSGNERSCDQQEKGRLTPAPGFSGFCGTLQAAVFGW